jgi:predicted lipid-binding transport protein (Tim44 family)
MACESCVQELERQQPKDSHAGYVRGLLFGIGAAIVGLIFYAGFTIVTGIYIGYVSLAVGWLVGKAIMLGSKGIGGRRYQIAAVILTYAAVSLAAIPIAISYYVKAKPASQSIQLKQQNPSTNAANDHPDQTQSKPKPSMGAAFLRLLALGLASPFLELQDAVHGIIGLVILMVGIRIAWQITAGSRRADIQGPYENSTAASVR